MNSCKSFGFNDIGSAAVASCFEDTGNTDFNPLLTIIVPFVER